MCCVALDMQYVLCIEYLRTYIMRRRIRKIEKLLSQYALTVKHCHVNSSLNKNDNNILNRLEIFTFIERDV